MYRDVFNKYLGKYGGKFNKIIQLCIYFLVYVIDLGVVVFYIIE